MPGRRTYRSELRRRQAEQTRSRVVAAAAELFAAEGYARTTLAKIASQAGVSAETVQLHGPKAKLLIAAIEYAAVGVVGEENLLNLQAGRDLVAVADVDAAVDAMVALQDDVNHRTADLAQALHGGAAADPELQRYRAEVIAGVNSQIHRVLEIFEGRGWLRDDVAFDELVETTAVICSVDTYIRMNRHDGWTRTACRAWCRRMLLETVFRVA
ncbi:regulatory protein, tetR family [Mycolicibacterium rutilum]|uniref:Regulatory protein, tetR family n=2 Tax=Mycolicibacterium rutilum TaxID=370526 RepID=A0A1H6KRL3_MYCRU|nr:regulatory protein, tetR family [Mycolicibacterium rutilum]